MRATIEIFKAPEPRARYIECIELWEMYFFADILERLPSRYIEPFELGEIDFTGDHSVDLCVVESENFEIWETSEWLETRELSEGIAVEIDSRELSELSKRCGKSSKVVTTEIQTDHCWLIRCGAWIKKPIAVAGAAVAKEIIFIAASLKL